MSADALSGAGSETPAVAPTSTESQTPAPAPVKELKDPRLDQWNTPTDDEIEAYERQEAAKKAKKPDSGSDPAGNRDDAQPDADDEGDDDDPAKAVQKRLQRAHARGDRLRRERNDARGENRNLRAQLEAANAELARVQALRNKKVDLEAMDYNEREDHRLDQALLRQREDNVKAHKAQLEGQANEAQAFERRQADIDAADQLQAAVEKDAERFPGLWDKLMEVQKDAKGKDMVDRRGNPVPVVAITSTMMRFAQRSPVAVPLLHALANNPDLAAQIHDLDEMGQVAAIAELSGRIQAAERRTVSKTPNPSTRLRGGKAPSAKSMDELAADDSPEAMKEYMRRRNEQMAKGQR